MDVWTKLFQIDESLPRILYLHHFLNFIHYFFTHLFELKKTIDIFVTSLIRIESSENTCLEKFLNWMNNQTICK